jgi:DNA-directed RNA polymerase alpha subunit
MLFSRIDLLKIPDFGSKALRSVEESLKKQGLSLRENCR